MEQKSIWNASVIPEDQLDFTDAYNDVSLPIGFIIAGVLAAAGGWAAAIYQWLPSTAKVFIILGQFSGGGLVAFGMVAYASARHNQRPLQSPVALANGWFRIPIDISFQRHSRNCAICAVVWLAYCAVILIDFTKEKEADAAIIPLFALLSLACAGFGIWRAWKNGWFSHYFQDAILQINQSEIYSGDTLHLRIQLPIRNAVEINWISLALVCFGTKFVRWKDGSAWAWREISKDWTNVAVNSHHTPGKDFEAEFQLRFRPDSSASTAHDFDGQPRRRWHISLKVDAPKISNLEIRFPITVVAR